MILDKLWSDLSFVLLEQVEKCWVMTVTQNLTSYLRRADLYLVIYPYSHKSGHPPPGHVGGYGTRPDQGMNTMGGWQGKVHHCTRGDGMWCGIYVVGTFLS